MKNILNTELKRLADLLSQVRDTASFNAYLEKIKKPETLSYVYYISVSDKNNLFNRKIDIQLC